MKFLALAAFAASCYAACFNVTRLAGDAEMSGSCIDELTGFEFEYYDIGKVLEDETTTEDLSTRMYSAYLSGAGQPLASSSDSTQLQKRDQIFWNECVPERVAGVCSSSYSVTWNAGLSSFQDSLATIFAAVESNDRTYQSPRSICSKFSAGTICVSWADYYHNDLQTAQIKDIVHECTYVCEQQYDSCLARARTGSKLEYYCVSNRSKGCGVDRSIKPCD